MAPTKEMRKLFSRGEEVSGVGLGVRVALGANVALALPFDPVVYERTLKKGGLTIVALSQVAADLLTSPGRGPNEAEALMEWMRENEAAWRA